MMKLSKTSSYISENSFIGLGHFDEVKIQLQENSCILPLVEESNKEKNNSQMFYLYSNEQLVFNNPFYIFIFSYQKSKHDIETENVIKLHTTNNANEVYFYSSNKLEDCFTVAVKIKEQSAFTHTVLCFDPAKFNSIDEDEKITKMIVRLVVHDYKKLEKFKDSTGFSDYGHKFGNYDVILFKNEVTTGNAMSYFISTSDNYIYKEDWKDMTLNATCSEFYFNNITPNELKYSDNKILADLKIAGEKFCNKFKRSNSVASVLISAIDIFQRVIVGEYSDYAILNFWGPLKMLYEKLERNPKYVGNKSLYEISNVMNNIISDIFNSTLHTFQMPIPVEPSCSIHLYLLLRYIAFLNFFVESTEEICFKDLESKNSFHLSFLFNSIDSYIISTETCFKSIENPPDSRLLIINMPRKYVTKPSILLAISIHELAHSMDYDARLRKRRYFKMKKILVDGFSYYLIASLYDACKEKIENVIDYVSGLGIKDIIDNEMDDILNQSDINSNHYYFNEIEKYICDEIESVIRLKASKIIKIIAKKAKEHADIIMGALDKAIASFLFGNIRYSLRKSLDDIYYVLDECFSDMVMISTLNLEFREYSNIINYIDTNFNNHKNRDTVRYNLIKSLYDKKPEIYENNTSQGTQKSNINFEDLAIFSFPPIFDDLKEHMENCKIYFENDISSESINSKIEKIREDYRQICGLEDNTEKTNHFDLFENFDKDIEIFRNKVYKDIISKTAQIHKE